MKFEVDVNVRFVDSPAIERRLEELFHALATFRGEIMTVISEFAAKQKAFNDAQGTAIDSLVSSVSGVAADVIALNDKIMELQNSQGQVTPEDQASIDELQAQGGALKTRMDAVVNSLAALDAQTPPKPPVG